VGYRGEPVDYAEVRSMPVLYFVIAQKLRDEGENVWKISS
jgi:hypothetical protein